MTSANAAAGPMLEKLTAMKRQKAEQEMLALMAEVRRIEGALTALGADLDGLDASEGAGDLAALAYQHGRLTQLLADIRQRQAALPLKAAELEDARQALRRALYSEEQIARLLGGIEG